MSQSQAYPQPNASYSQAPAQRGQGMAVASLVLGILALVTSITVVGGVILGVLALIFGIIGVKRAGRGEADGRGKAVAGIITGAAGIVIAIALVALGASILNSSSVKSLRTCLNNAGGNQAAVQQCNTQFRQQVQHQYGG